MYCEQCSSAPHHFHPLNSGNIPKRKSANNSRFSYLYSRTHAHTPPVARAQGFPPHDRPKITTRARFPFGSSHGHLLPWMYTLSTHVICPYGICETFPVQASKREFPVSWRSTDLLQLLLWRRTSSCVASCAMLTLVSADAFKACRWYSWYRVVILGTSMDGQKIYGILSNYNFMLNLWEDSRILKCVECATHESSRLRGVPEGIDIVVPCGCSTLQGCGEYSSESLPLGWCHLWNEWCMMFYQAVFWF